MGSFIFQLFHLVLAFLQLQLQIIQLSQNGIQTLILCGKMLLCRFDHALRDAQLFADEERIGFARHADAQLIGRAQRVQIQLTAGIDNALGFQSKHLQLRVVSGGHQQHAAAAQLFNDGHSQRSTFGGVGTGTKLVQQHQCVRHGKLQNAGDLFHMTGEGGKALLNALFIADIHQKFVKYADLAALVSRDQKAALRHGAQQARCFQGDGFATGVRSGDDQRIVIPAQSNIHRHALFRIDQRVARTDQREGIVGADSRLECLEIQSQPCLCQQNIDLQHSLVAVLELRLNGGHLCGKGHQNALDLLRFLRTVLQNAGIGFHNGLRLHKDGGSGRRNIMNNAAHLTAVFALDRHNIPAIAHGNHAFL